ncbi:MAG: S8 family peptidase [Bacteroidia bacterium]
MRLLPLVLGGLLSIGSQGQELNGAQQWFHLDREADNVAGISAHRTYANRFGATTPREVIVAVIDAGVDIKHEDLKDVLWINTGEIPDNGIDDDGNGYIDDLYGWSFLSGPGGEVHHDTYELVRELRRMRALNAEGKIAKGSTDAAYLSKLEKHYKEEYKEMKKAFGMMTKLKTANDAFFAAIPRETISVQRIEAFKPKGSWQKIVKSYYLQSLKAEVAIHEAETKLMENYEQIDGMFNYGLDLTFDPRNKVGDVYDDWANRIYGDNRVIGPDASHGTHVAGIIAATRYNDIGMNGIAVNARIMTLRAVPNGDEHDKDIANAIRYAVDNGATIINMSFGKSYSPQRWLVHEAILYALEKDALLIHAAGNDAKNIDEEENFPSPIAPDGTRYPHWIEVGASSFQWSDRLVADFSNYGQKNVDVFAPGFHIYSTMPGNRYDFNSGTSMAAPVVSGVAAVIRGMYPELSAYQVRDIIRRSAVGYESEVILPGSKKKKIAFNQLSNTGGVVNLDRAFDVISQLDFDLGEFNAPAQSIEE